MKNTTRIYKREALIEELKQQNITNQKVLQAIREIPRELFLPRDLQKHAYDNVALPIGHEQTISEPYTVAYMLQMLEIKKGQNILEIGTGHGYNTALLSTLVGKTGKVTSLEIVKPLAQQAKKNIKRLDMLNVTILNADGSIGYPKAAPYGRIIATAATPKIQLSWKEQLKDKGIIVAPVGKYIQAMTKVTKQKSHYSLERYGEFQFVPLKGKEGFKG